MDATISTKLRMLADRVLAGHDAPEVTVTVLRLLAEQYDTAILLPTVDPARDDLAHWRGLTDQKLRNENGADAWNLAAGLHVARERTTATTGDAALNEAYAAQFSYRARAVQP